MRQEARLRHVLPVGGGGFCSAAMEGRAGGNGGTL